MSLPRLSTVSVMMPGSMPSLGAPICFSRSLTMRSSSSRMFLRRPSIFFCTSTTGTSVTMPSAASSRSRIFFSRSSLRLRPQRLHQEVLLGGQLPGLAAVLGGVLQHGVDRLHQALRLLVGRGRPRAGPSRELGGRGGTALRGAAGALRGRWPAAGLGVDCAKTGLAMRRRQPAPTSDGRNRTADSEHGTRTSCNLHAQHGVANSVIFVSGHGYRSVTISAVDPRVGRLDQVEQVGIHLPRVGQHQHVRDGGAGALAAWPSAPAHRRAASPRSRPSRSSVACSVTAANSRGARERDVGRLRRDGEAGNGARGSRPPAAGRAAGSPWPPPAACRGRRSRALAAAACGAPAAGLAPRRLRPCASAAACGGGASA